MREIRLNALVCIKIVVYLETRKVMFARIEKREVFIAKNIIEKGRGVSRHFEQQ